MEEKDLKRLREEQEKAIQSTDEELTTWKKFRSDYTALQERLRTLPDKLSHPIMVPFGSKAFMPGKLVHTNEVLVLLGDNWFVDRSAKQACEIIDRRLVGINKQIDDLEKQRELLQPRADFTSELQDMHLARARGDMMEIQEEYDPVKEKKWREQHRKNVQEHRKRLKEDKKNVKAEKTVEKSKEKPKTDAELWARLDELEKIETSRNEMSRLNLNDGEVEAHSDGVQERTVRWADQQSESEDSDDSQGETTEPRPKSIRFSHTKLQGDTAASAETTEPDTDPPHITSPADIYKLFGSGQPTVRSILKPQTTTTTDNTEVTTVDTESVKNTSSVKAFSGSIMERETTSATSAKNLEIPKADVQSKPPPKRVSKFKTDRLKQQADNAGK